MHQTQGSFGHSQTGTISHDSYYILAFKDTGPSHQICDITDNQLDIKGILCIKELVFERCDSWFTCPTTHLLVRICPKGPISIAS